MLVPFLDKKALNKSKSNAFESLLDSRHIFAVFAGGPTELSKLMYLWNFPCSDLGFNPDALCRPKMFNFGPYMVIEFPELERFAKFLGFFLALDKFFCSVEQFETLPVYYQYLFNVFRSCSFEFMGAFVFGFFLSSAFVKPLLETAMLGSVQGAKVLIDSEIALSASNLSFSKILLNFHLDLF